MGKDKDAKYNWRLFKENVLDLLKDKVNDAEEIDFAVPVCRSLKACKKSDFYFEMQPGNINRGKIARV